MGPILDGVNILEINLTDLKIETINMTGVRVTHVPTGIVVENTQERSQLMNRQAAMAILKMKLENN